jgi:flagellar export protein FliJ
MPRFHFRLQTLLSLREAARDDRQARLAGNLAVERELAERQATIERALNTLRERTRSSTGPGPIDVERLRLDNRYERTLRSDLAELTSRRRALADEIEACRQELAAADREVRVLEKLRERQHERFRHEEQVRETGQLDEVAAETARKGEP